MRQATPLRTSVNLIILFLDDDSRKPVMNILKIGLLLIWGWGVAMAARWLISGSIDFAGSVISAVVLTGGVMIGDRYLWRQQKVPDQTKN